MKKQLRQLLWGILFAILLVASYPAFAFFDPTIGCWISRDPIGERGGLNLNAFLRNDGVNFFDADGRITVTTLTKNPKSDCGSYDIQWQFVLSLIHI